MIPILVSTETRRMIVEVASLREPEETVLLLGNIGWGQVQAHLVDRNLVNDGVDVYLGTMPDDIKVYTSGNIDTLQEDFQILLESARTKPNFCSDSFSLESQLGYQIICTIQPATTGKSSATQTAHILNV